MDGSLIASNAIITGKASLSELVANNVTAGDNIITKYGPVVNHTGGGSTMMQTMAAWQSPLTGTVRLFMRGYRYSGTGDCYIGFYKRAAVVPQGDPGTSTVAQGSAYALAQCNTSTTTTYDMSISQGEIVVFLASADASTTVYAYDFTVSISQSPGVWGYISSVHPISWF